MNEGHADILPLIFTHVGNKELAQVIPFVSQTWREYCRYVTVEWDMHDFPQKAQDMLFKAAEQKRNTDEYKLDWSPRLTFLMYNVHGIALRSTGVNNVAAVMSLAPIFPRLQILDMRRCYGFESCWEALIEELHAFDKLKAFYIPHCRLNVKDGFPEAFLLRVRRVLFYDDSESDETDAWISDSDD